MVGGERGERERERDREGAALLPPSVPLKLTQLAKLLFVPPSEAKRTALLFDAAAADALPPPMMLRAEKTDEHKLPHFIDNQPRSAARTREHGTLAAGSAWK